MIIPGPVIAALTFPGVMMHEAGHVLGCVLTNTSVLQVCWFRIGNPPGYVRCARASPWKVMLISVAPFVSNTAIGYLLGVVATRHMNCALAWIAFSIAMHAFPSSDDAEAIREAVGSRRTPFACRMVAASITAFIRIASVASTLWGNAAYGYWVSRVAPEIMRS